MEDKLVFEIIVGLCTVANVWMNLNVKYQITQLELRLTNKFFEGKKGV